MTDKSEEDASPISRLLEMQDEAARRFLSIMVPGAEPHVPAPEDWPEWMAAAQRMQQLWLELQAELGKGEGSAMPFSDPARWGEIMTRCWQSLPINDPDTQRRLMNDGLTLWQGVLGQFGLSPSGTPLSDAQVTTVPDLPRQDRRFSDPMWSAQPFYAVVHQIYLMLSDEIMALVEKVDGIDDEQREQLRFASQTLVDALSPANFPFTNPLVMDKLVATKGQSLVKGLENLLADIRRGQLTHTDPTAFEVGRNIATTPGKVVYETELFQLIQYSPVTEEVLETPLVIFPPWINRFYILDLNEKKSFVRWAVAQGLTVFMVSWKSADATMADVSWDDYIRAQIEAIDHVRDRLAVKRVHTIGYCVAGTTMAATLAVLARRGEAGKVASATFFTAQVDFERAGELKVFINDSQLQAIGQLTGEGYLDGRYMAATFNLLRSRDLIWAYVVSHYLLGEEYPAFDLLHWNGDTTNLPACWHQNYLRDLYRDNRMVTPDALSADGTPIDLTRIETPAYVQAGREDHIAPAESVFRIRRHLRGPIRFVLAGSGHIAGVVNPPESGKYQYWLNDGPAETLDEFAEGASEHPGSWWPDWIEWLRGHGGALVKAKGRRKPGGKGDKVIEDAPGRYVKMR